MKDRTYNIIMGILITICLGLSGWALSQVYNQAQTAATHTAQLETAKDERAELRAWKDSITPHLYTRQQASELKAELRTEFIDRVETKFELISRDVEYIKKQLDGWKP
ncbi:MAG: hypothetical protein ABQ298_03760 [Puniceicoccaceae bacterium]